MTQCPACGSSRIRNDYKPSPLALRIFFVRALLCDHCNHQFKAFSFADTPPQPRQSSAARAAVSNPPPAIRAVDLTRLKGDSRRSDSQSQQDHPRPQIRHDLINEINSAYGKEAEDQTSLKHQDQEQPGVADGPACAHCGSTNVKRRRRTIFERTLFSATDHKAFTCCACGETFYSRVEDDENNSGAIDAAGRAS